MTYVVSAFRRTVIVVSIASAGCTASNNTPASGTVTATAPATGGIAITLTSDPNPPKSGDNSFVVTVKQPDGTPLTDGTVKAVFSMPAMPSMNMPAMRSDATLSHEGGGTYRGPGQLSMAGTWDVTVSVSFNGQEVGSQRFSIIAK